MMFVFLWFFALPQPTYAETVKVKGHVPTGAIAKAKDLGRMDRSQQLNLSVALKLNNETGLQQFIKDVHNAANPNYGNYLTPAQFKSTYGAKDSDVQAIQSYFTALGFKVAKTQSGQISLVTDVKTVEKSLGVEMHNFQAKDGRKVYASTLEPQIESKIASKIHGLVGLQTFGKQRPNLKKPGTLKPFVAQGSGPSGSLAPSDIRTAYSLNSLTQDGTGETVALFELEAYNPSDVQMYVNKFGLSTPNIQNVLVDGATAVPDLSGDADGVGEANLDVDMLIVTAPKAKILFYNAPNSDQGVIDNYTRIANDNLATVVSTSYGGSEDEMAGATLESLNSILEQMAAQGQSVFVATGDSGAYDDGSTVSVDMPASSPYACAVGGTTVTLNATTKAFVSESSWNDQPSVPGQTGAGGGGISSAWAIADYQAGLGTTTNLGGARGRMMPDVSLHASDSVNPYGVYVGGQLEQAGGTSFAAPLWAGFMVLVNQKRVAAGMPRIGFPNPDLYRVGLSSVAASNFYDIADGSTNQYYPAVKGYDLSTGLGSFVGSALLNSLTSATLPPAAPTQLTATVVGQ